MLRLATSAAALAMIASAASATTFTFNSVLNSAQAVPASDSSATGTATLKIDDVDETLDFRLDVSGITLDGLWDTLVAAPAGPIHFHDAPKGSTGPIVIPFPFDMTYAATDDGFSLTTTDYAFATAIDTAGVSETFDEFLDGMLKRSYYINIHTDVMPDGEIRGQLTPVPLPAGLPLLLGAFGVMAVVRRRRG